MFAPLGKRRSFFSATSARRRAWRPNETCHSMVNDSETIHGRVAPGSRRPMSTAALPSRMATG
jgi:hypothetical protein